MNIKSILRKPYYRIRNYFYIVCTLIKLNFISIKYRNIEIGSGSKKRAGWLTLDMCSGSDIFWDLNLKMPFKDNSFERVYCSHVLEHFKYYDLKKLLKDVYRVLEPGGEFLIAVPNASIYIDAYFGVRSVDSFPKYDPAVISNKKMDLLNYIFYMDGQHKFMFDEENLTFHLAIAGFYECKLRDFNPELDLKERDYESLYMIGRKPYE